MRTLRQIRGYLSAQAEDPYAGGDLANAQRLGAVLWTLLLVIVLVIVPLSPPDEAIAPAGWVVAALLGVGNVALIMLLRRQLLASWNALLAVSYLTLSALGVMHWLAGGVGAPYGSLLVLPVLFAGATHPIRRVVPVLGVTLLVLAAPFLYDPWDADRAASGVAGFVIACALAVVANLLMSGVRAQRVAHERDEADARHEARLDSLTGLLNRRAFNEGLGREVARATRQGTPLSVALVDLENFKEVNDRWGLAEGDRCLREVAAVLQETLRLPDLGFRWGGDEFALVLSGAAGTDAAAIGERICGEIAERCRRPDGEPLVARFAYTELDGNLTPEELVERAGLALTAVKA